MSEYLRLETRQERGDRLSRRGWGSMTGVAYCFSLIAMSAAYIASAWRGFVAATAMMDFPSTSANDRCVSAISNGAAKRVYLSLKKSS
jgi:hypothetical protein